MAPLFFVAHLRFLYCQDREVRLYFIVVRKNWDTKSVFFALSANIQVPEEELNRL